MNDAQAYHEFIPPPPQSLGDITAVSVNNARHAHRRQLALFDAKDTKGFKTTHKIWNAMFRRVERGLRAQIYFYRVYSTL